MKRTNRHLAARLLPTAWRACETRVGVAWGHDEPTRRGAGEPVVTR